MSDKQHPSRGRLLVVTGFLSAGKTTVSREVMAKAPAFFYFDGDDFIRRTPEHLRVTQTPRILGEMISELKERLDDRTDVLLDVSLPGRFLETIRDSFHPDVLIVGLQVEEQERRRREHTRGVANDPARIRAASLRHLAEPRGLFDIELDTTTRSPAECADAILARFQEF